MKPLIYLGLLLTTFVLSTSGEHRTIELLCDENDLPCGGWGCYNTQTEICHKLGQDRLKCLKTQSICKHSSRGYCYNPATQQCIWEEDTWTLKVCLKGEKLCGSKCFNPATQDCIDKRSICPKGEQLCIGGKDKVAFCYDPKINHCSQGNLCRIDQKACNGECYSSNVNKKCFQTVYNYPYDEIMNYKDLWSKE